MQPSAKPDLQQTHGTLESLVQTLTKICQTSNHQSPQQKEYVFSQDMTLLDPQAA